MAAIRYQLHKQSGSSGWMVIAFNEKNELIQQVINIASASTALDLIKIHAGNNLPLLNLVNILASEPKITE